MINSSEGHHKPRFYYGWIIVIVVALAGFTQSAETYPVLGVFLKPMTKEFGWSRSVFTGAASIGTLLGGVLALVTGPLLDRYGPRWMLTIGFIILGGSLILMSGISALWQYYVLQIIGRVMLMGVVAMAVQVIIPKWFVEKRGRAVALSGLGMRAGNTITPLYVQFLVSTWSWRAGTAVSGVVIWMASLLPVAIFLRRRPEDMGLLPDGVTPEEFEQTLDTAPGTGAHTPRQEVSLSVRQVVRLPSFYLLTAAFSLLSIVLPGTLLHLIPYLTDQGLSDGVAVAIVSVWSASGAIGGLIFGFLAERRNIRLVLAGGILLMAAGFFFLLIVESPVRGFIWGFYTGLLGGGIFTLQQVVFADYYGRDSLGAIRGIFWPVQLVANSVGPVIAAYAYDTTGNYALIFTVFGILILVSSLCIFLARPPVVLPHPVTSLENIEHTSA